MGLSRWVRARFARTPVRFDQPQTARFSVSPVDQLVHWAENRVGRIDRAKALSVPAVLRGRNMICSISTLPLQAVDEDNRIQDHPLLRQIDPNVPNVTTLATLIEDLLFEAEAWLRITRFDDFGYPAAAVRYAPGDVSLQPPPGYQLGTLPSGLPTEGVVWMEGHPVPWAEVIRFDSPNPPLLEAGERAIRRAIELDEAADLFAGSPRMRGYFAPSDPNVDPGTDEEITAALDAFALARKQHLDGYIGSAMQYHPVQDPTPAELQLIAQQQRADLAIANALGIDPEDLGISTTSRTYQNATDRRKDKINETLAPYMAAITGRLAMDDVTQGDVRVRFGLDDYLRADPKTRAEVEQIYVDAGVMDAAEVREIEGLPPRAITSPVPPTQISAIPDGARMSRTFSREGLSFDYQADATFAVDAEARTITGLAVPWGKVARSNGRRYRFARGAVKWGAINRVKLLRDHVNSSAIGKAVRLEDTDAGLVATFRVSEGRAGDEALALAADEVLDGLSIGVDFREADLKPDPENPGAFLVSQAALREVSLTAVPAFDDSRLTSVRAADEEGPGMDPETTTEETVPADQPVTLTSEQFSALMGRLGPAEPATERPTVDPTTRPVATTQVAEALPYRFSYEKGGRYTFAADAEHDFSSDLFALMGNKPGAADAEKRVNGLVRAAFADVENADVTAINPNRYRPDLWQPQMDYSTPLWDMINAGTTDGSKFDVPKYNSSSGLVSAATEKTEPAGGSMTVDSQTVTPTQVWGKVEITRQAWRAGGSPQLSGILWAQMLREYYEDREAAVATFLNTLTAAVDITLTATPSASPDNDDDRQTVRELEAAISDLQFSRGGNRFSAFAVHQELYRVLTRVTNDVGDALYPQINPQNRNGTSQPLWRFVDVGGTRAVPSWALGEPDTAESNSWLFDPAKVRGWAGAPERLFWDFGATVQTANLPQLSFVTLGIYGDVALANLDINGVRQVRFDPSS